MTLELTYENFTNGDNEQIGSDRFLIRGSEIYVFHLETPCVLTLFLNGDDVCEADGERVGRLLRSSV